MLTGDSLAGNIHTEELRGHLDWLERKMEAISRKQSNNTNATNNSNLILMEGSASSLRGVAMPKEPVLVGDANTIVCGDFNEGWLGGGYQYLEKRHFYNALNLSDEKNTWYWPLPLGFNMWGSYDHIFCHTGSFLVQSCYAMKDYIHVSDHIPVVATISARDSKPKETIKIDLTSESPLQKSNSSQKNNNSDDQQVI